jgi:hypothetical protein
MPLLTGYTKTHGLVNIFFCLTHWGGRRRPHFGLLLRVHAAEVAANEEAGEVEKLRLAAANGLGLDLNPSAAEGLWIMHGAYLPLSCIRDLPELQKRDPVHWKGKPKNLYCLKGYRPSPLSDLLHPAANVGGFTEINRRSH